MKRFPVAARETTLQEALVISSQKTPETVSQKARRAALQTACLSLFFFAASCASIPVHIVPDGRKIPADFAGIVHSGKAESDIEFQQLEYLGVKWTLHTFEWHLIEAAQGEWDISRFEKIVSDCNAAGIKIIALLAYDTYWIHKDGRLKKYIPADRLPDFLEYVRKTVEHFHGRVDAWAVWNEPNFHFWTGTEDEFIELSRQTTDVIREIDKDGIILGGSFNAFPFTPPVKFIRNLFKSGAMEKVDYIAFHPYEITVTRSVLLYEQFRKVVGEFGFADKIWITEIGFPTGGWYPHKISLKKFPEAVIKTYAHFAYSGVMNVLWYQLYDPVIRKRPPPRHSEDYFGLIRSPADPSSKAAEAFRLCALYMSDTTCYALTPERDRIPRSIQAFWFKGEKTSALVLWNDNSGVSRLNIRLSGAEHTRHDIVTGKETAIPGEITVNAGSEPVFITWQVNSESAGERPIISR